MIVELTEEEADYIRDWAQAYANESFTCNPSLEPPDQTPVVNAILAKMGRGPIE